MADYGNHKVRKIEIATGKVTTLAGSREMGSADGMGTAASFGWLSGITSDGSSLYVTDTDNHIRKIEIVTGRVTTMTRYGKVGFEGVTGIVTDGSSLYVADWKNNVIRKIVISSGAMTRLAGSGKKGGMDGIGTAASFDRPTCITIENGSLIVVDSGNNKIRKIAIDSGSVTTLALTEPH